MDEKPTIKELEAQIEVLKRELYFPVNAVSWEKSVGGIEEPSYLQRTWQDQCHILETENAILKDKLAKIAAHLAGSR
jgi:hypothetical protein|tara:strand:+ start:300 stop:530 length:231 start_codon:yes stop_codon:yes gene_type:complete